MKPKRRFFAPIILGIELLFARAGLAAPGNELCEDAEALSFPDHRAGSTGDATVEQEPTLCGTDDRFAVWYSFEAPADAQYTFTAAGDALADTTIGVYDTCDPDSVVLCNDDTLDGLAARIDIHLVAGQSVLVRVAGWGRTRGAFDLVVDEFGAFARPVNDACEDAVAVTQDERAPGTTLNATGDDVSSCGADDPSDIWYSFVAPAAATYDFSLTQNMTSAHFLALYDDCGGAELACGFLGTSAALAAGQSVRIRVGTNPSVADDFNVVVGPAPPSIPPTNDTFDAATPVGVPSTTTGTTRGATEDALNWGPVCGPFVNDAVWYSFVAPDDDIYVFDTNGSELPDTIVALFEDCLESGASPPALLGCDADSGTGQSARLDGFITAGTSLCIAVAGHHLSEIGGVTLNVSRLGPPPDNDHCDGALPIVIGDPIVQDNATATPATAEGSCPFGNFPLWYSFTAPETGLYKFDTKASHETFPDIALYDDCNSTAEPLACSIDPYPAVHLEMEAGRTVLVRTSTDVFWRGMTATRVGPVREEEPVGGAAEGGGGANAEGGGGTSGGADSDGGGGRGGGSADDDGDAPSDGCDCATGSGRAGETGLAFSLLFALRLVRRRRAEV